jgi:hypothetical protein
MPPRPVERCETGVDLSRELLTEKENAKPQELLAWSGIGVAMTDSCTGHVVRRATQTRVEGGFLGRRQAAPSLDLALLDVGRRVAREWCRHARIIRSPPTH